jgi:hypothetical protein
MEIRRDVVTAPYDVTGHGVSDKAGVSVALGFLVFIFIIGTVSGIGIWQYFR